MGFEVARAEGSYIYDREGQQFTDLLSGICINNFGHRHPAILRAYQDQLEQYSFTMVYGEHVQHAQAIWAEQVAQRYPYLSQSYLLTTGTETVEAAMKLARRATGRTEIISMSRSYHGSTQGSLSLMDDLQFTGAYRPLIPGVKHIRFNEPQDLVRITSRTAAVITEVFQSATGITIPDPDYHTQLRARCTEVGALLVYDEIQTGFGRCGTVFAHEQVGAIPDLLCLAKAMGGGLPVAALCGDRDLLQQFTHDPVFGHISSMGGHPVAMAGAVAVWNLLTETDLLEHSVVMGQMWQKALSDLSHVSLRQRALYMSVVLPSADRLDQAIHQLHVAGYLVGRFFFEPRALRITPPLTMSEQEVKKSVSDVCSILSELV